MAVAVSVSVTARIAGHGTHGVSINRGREIVGRLVIDLNPQRWKSGRSDRSCRSILTSYDIARTWLIRQLCNRAGSSVIEGQTPRSSCQPTAFFFDASPGTRTDAPALHMPSDAARPGGPGWHQRPAVAKQESHPTAGHDARLAPAGGGPPRSWPRTDIRPSGQHDAMFLHPKAPGPEGRVSTSDLRSPSENGQDSRVRVITDS
jgi:hypothetical protein